MSVIAFNYLSSGLEYPKYQYKLEKSYLDLDAETSAGILFYFERSEPAEAARSAAGAGEAERI